MQDLWWDFFYNHCTANLAKNRVKFFLKQLRFDRIMAMTLEYRFFGPSCIVRVSLVQCTCSEQALMVCVRTSWKLLHNGPVVRYTEARGATCHERSLGHARCISPLCRITDRATMSCHSSTTLGRSAETLISSTSLPNNMTSLSDYYWRRYIEQ